MGNSYRHLSPEERVEIYRLRCAGLSYREIGSFLNRSASTISREFGRNCGDRRGRKGPYCPVKADRRSWLRRRMHRRFKMARQPELRGFVRDKLAMGWSPEQISGWLALHDSPMRISHESIYRYVYHRTGHSDYRDPWYRLLPLQRYRRGLKRKRPGPLGVIKDRQGLDARSVQAIDRRTAGHWEADLMCFSKAGPVLLIAHERHSRQTFASFHETKASRPLMEAISSYVSGLPRAMRQTIAFDNGTEFADHRFLARRVGMEAYFCAPKAPWQKGGVENAIKRLRRWLPRRTRIETMTDRELAKIMQRYNSTPRKCLGYRTPEQVFKEAITVALQS